MGNEESDIILAYVEKYTHILETKAQKKEEINTLKLKISKLEDECEHLDSDTKQAEVEMQAEIYHRYTIKDLLKMIPIVEKHSNKEVADDFRSLVDKFSNHKLRANDISQLATYFKIYGKYVRNENSIIKGLFKALGGNLDD